MQHPTVRVSVRSAIFLFLQLALAEHCLNRMERRIADTRSKSQSIFPSFIIFYHHCAHDHLRLAEWSLDPAALGFDKYALPCGGMYSQICVIIASDNKDCDENSKVFRT